MAAVSFAVYEYVSTLLRQQLEEEVVKGDNNDSLDAPSCARRGGGHDANDSDDLTCGQVCPGQG
jgi:hypothetical protein